MKSNTCDRDTSHIAERSAMRHQPRMKLLATFIGVALAQWGLGVAHADSAVGVDTALGNAANPSGRSNIPRPLLEDGGDTVRHSPTGQLYGLPYDLTTPPNKTDSGWEYKGKIDFGVNGGTADKKSSLFREYKDPKNGLQLNYFDFEAENPASANYLQVLGGSVGQDDEFYGVKLGRYNDWKVSGFFNRAPHVFSDNFKPIFTNNGTGVPTLTGPAAADPATGPFTNVTNPTNATAAAKLFNYSQSLPDTEVGLIRAKAGIRLDANLSNQWKSYLSLSQESRKGERPFGFQDNTTEGVEPINYSTTDILAGLSYLNGPTAFNLRGSVSLFKNDIDVLYNRESNVALTSPFGTEALPLTLGTIPYQRYVLSPDNKAYNLKAEFAQKLPGFFNGKFNAAVAWGTSRQNDALQPAIPFGVPGVYTTASIPGTQVPSITTVAGLPAVAPGDINNWNGVNGTSTSRATSGQRTDSTLLSLSLALNPLDDLSVKGTFRHYATSNKAGTYYAFNPLTGQWGYGLGEDPQAFSGFFVVAANGVGCQAPPGSTILPAVQANCGTVGLGAQPVAPVLNYGQAGVGVAAGGGGARSYFTPPRDNKQDNLTLAADYDLSKNTSVEGSYERENFSHTYRERDKTWEDKLKVGYVNRGLGNATLRASYEDDRKRGSFYDQLGVSRGLPGWFAIYGLNYSRALLEQAVQISADIAAAGTPAAVAAAAAAAPNGLPTVAGAYPTVANWLNGGVFLPGGLYSGRWQKPDEADRDQGIFNARLNWMAREDLDIGAFVQLKRVRYPANEIGLQRDDVNTFSVDANYQLASGSQFTAFYTRQSGRQAQVENYGNTNVAGVNVALSAANYINGLCGGPFAGPSQIQCFIENGRDPLANVQVDYRNNTDVIGFGLTQDFRKVLVGANYSYSKSISAVNRTFGPSALTPAQQAIETAFPGWPDMVTVQQSLDLNVQIPVTKKATVRLAYRYSDAKVKDWHYDYYVTPSAPTAPDVTPIPGNMGSYNGGMDYKAHVFGVFLQYSL